MALLTTAGKTNRQTTGLAKFLYVAVGTGTQTELESLTVLKTEIARVPVATPVLVDGDVINFEAFLSNGQGNGTLTEQGIFDQLAGGTLQEYGVLTTAILKTSGKGGVVAINDTLSNA